jgi:hypothetical protein
MRVPDHRAIGMGKAEMLDALASVLHGVEGVF